MVLITPKHLHSTHSHIIARRAINFRPTIANHAHHALPGAPPGKVQILWQAKISDGLFRLIQGLKCIRNQRTERGEGVMSQWCGGWGGWKFTHSLLEKTGCWEKPLRVRAIEWTRDGQPNVTEVELMVMAWFRHEGVNLWNSPASSSSSSLCSNGSYSRRQGKQSNQRPGFSSHNWRQIFHLLLGSIAHQCKCRAVCICLWWRWWCLKSVAD